MLLSIIFSFVVYNVSISELEIALARQSELIDEIQPLQLPGLPLAADRIDAVRIQLEESNDQIKQDLLLANIAIFFGGGLLSFALARRTLRPIEEAHDQQQRFIADASHELRTPLTAIRAQLEVAKRKKMKATDAKEVFESSIEEVDRLANLTESLLKLSSSEGKTITPTPISAHELATEAKQRVNGLAKEKDINLVISTSDLLINCEHNSIVEVLVILLENAIKYSDSQTTVEISSAEKPNRICVSDHGAGIPKSAIPHLFERFYRVDLSRSKQYVDGYGIGLSIAEQIMQQHNGRIEVESQQGKGSTFTLVFPKTP